MKTRQAIANEEATRDPIFLFQWATLIIIETQMISYCSNCERIYSVLYDHNCDSEDGTLSDDDLLKNGWAKKEWHTEGVYLTREEGESFGKQKAYRYKNGWRVFCVCAEGSLAEILGRAQ